MTSRRFRNRASLAMVFGLVAAVVAAGSALAFPTTCNVPSSYGTIQVAIDDVSCDSVNIAAGVHTENLHVTRTVAIQSAGSTPSVTTTRIKGGLPTMCSKSHTTVV
jgi:hypothetical protein